MGLHGDQDSDDQVRSGFGMTDKNTLEDVCVLLQFLLQIIRFLSRKFKELTDILQKLQIFYRN